MARRKQMDTSKNIYIIEMPGKEPREITNINFDIVSKKVFELGGKIYLKPQPIPTPPPQVTTEHFTSNIPMSNAEVSFVERLYKLQMLALEIKKLHFSHCQRVMDCPVRLNNRLKRFLGYAHYIGNRTVGYRNFRVDIASRIFLRNDEKVIKQILFHEFTHVEFPGEKHRGVNFRFKEKYNPYRTKVTNKLTCIS